jgi:hypothetical protein
MRKTKGGVAYEERGSGFPFVALHGYTLDRRMSLGAFEPLFDAEGRAALLRAIRGRTAVIATHDPSLVEGCSRVVALHRGVVAYDGPAFLGCSGISYYRVMPEGLIKNWDGLQITVNKAIAKRMEESNSMNSRRREWRGGS